MSFTRSLSAKACSALLLACLGSSAVAQQRPTLNLMGVTGLIDMPSGESQPDGYLALNHSRFGPITRNTLTFQVTPRLSGSFRYVGVRQWNDEFCPPRCGGPNAFPTYYDRNFDVRYQLLLEGKYLPAVSIGLQDFVGTGLSMGEYVVATKSIGPRLKVTAGLGFGRLGSFGGMGSPLGDRPDVDFGKGGMINYSQWFRGPAAPFGGIEYKVTDKITFKAEYSSDAYEIESDLRKTFERRSPVNYGIEYQASNMIRAGLYSMYGSEIGFNISVSLNPAQRPSGGIGGQAPVPVKPRPPIADDPNVWSTGWLAQSDASAILIGSLNRNLVRTGITVESITLSGNTAQVRYRNTQYDAPSQAAGRVARAMTQTLPASVETFELVPVANGLAAAKVVMRRSDLETLEFAPDGAAALRARTTISDVAQVQPNSVANPELYPKFSWSIGPYTQTLLFDPREPIQYNLGLSLAARYEIAPGVILSGKVMKRVVGNMQTPRHYDKRLPLQPVRRLTDAYFVNADPALGNLTAAWYGKLAPNLYGRATAGYLELMFGGVSGEILWKPVNSRLALGVEANYVGQRNTDGGFGFDQFDYRVATGHASAYVDLGHDFTAQLDVGRYLAGDVGATVTLMRTFDNGWQIGAFATLTNVSAKDFGEGSFDKGLKFQIPLTWLFGQPTRATRTFTLRPIGRDGGARVEVSGRLYETLRGTDQGEFDAQWGRVWK